MNTLTLAAGCGLAVVLALWYADHSQQAKDAALKTVRIQEEEIKRLDTSAQALARELSYRAELQAQLNEITRGTEQLHTTLDGQTALINRNLAGLKNDKAIADYLGAAVPGALGLRYARPETTDPAAYRAAASGVQPGPVPATGAPGAGRQ